MVLGLSLQSKSVLRQISQWLELQYLGKLTVWKWVFHRVHTHTVTWVHQSRNAGTDQDRLSFMPVIMATS